MAHISLQNVANLLYVKQKFCSDRRVTRLTGSPLCHARVTLLARPTFLHVNTLACPAKVSVRGRVGLVKGVNFFLIKTFANVEGDPTNRDTFSPFKRSLS